MNIRFYNARICTMEKGAGIINGELWVSEDKITYVGTAKKDGTVFDREIDVCNNLLMPGFKNAHTHSAMVFLRSLADDMPLLDWLNTQVFPMEAKLTKEMVYACTKLGIMEYLTSGVTSNFDMYMFPEMIAKAAKDCGFRTVISSVISNFISDIETYEEDLLKYSNYDPLVSIEMSFHAEYTCSKELLEKISAVGRKYKGPIYTHNSESYEEVMDCKNRTGTTPTVYMDSLGLFENGGGLFHCVHMTDEDLNIVKKRGLYVVTNSGSNLKLASGIAPVKKMIDMGIPVAIGTDGAASNNCLDMFREMFLVTGLQKVAEKDASAVDAYKVLEMACSTGALAMGLDQCDCLAVGKLADLIIIDLNQPNMQPINNIEKNLVYSGSKQNVKLTMVGGKILYEDGKYNIGVCPDDVYREVNDIVATLKKISV